MIGSETPEFGVHLLSAVIRAISSGWNFLEISALAAAVLVACRWGALRLAVWESCERSLKGLARRRALAVLSTILLALVLRAAVLPLLPIPGPVMSDERSHLLLGDTLAGGRATNPTHPLWEHFETVHVIHRPTYQSMYFPAQGLFLAAGRFFAGHPWWGVWLSTGLMCGAICWMLQGWLPPGWALLGGALAAVRFGLFSYWANSYWGGAVPALGGALVFGAVGRLIQRSTAGAAWVLGAGLALLAASRPFEGLVVSVPAVGFLLIRMAACRGAIREKLAALARVFVPVALVLTLAGGTLTYYFWRVTGSPLRIPYQANRAMYGWPMTLPWFQPQPVQLRHKVLEDYYRWELAEHQNLVAPERALPELLLKAELLWRFYAGPALTLPLLFLPLLLRDRRVRLLLVAAAAGLAAVLLEQSSYPHYLAPATAPIVALIVQGLRHLGQWRFRGISGAFLARAVPAIVIAAAAVHAAALSAGSGYDRPRFCLSWTCGPQENVARSEMVRHLAASAGPHLVIVRYTHRRPYSWMFDYVYNPPDIDGARVVWARDLGPAANQRLIGYFQGRRVWLLEANETEAMLTPYGSEAGFGAKGLSLKAAWESWPAR
jgi:hypothetical protein